MSEGCSVLGCGNTFKKGLKNFYRFPRTALVQQQWVEFTRQKHIDPIDAFICEDHFSSDCLEKTHGIIRLSKNAVPTIGFSDPEPAEVDSIVESETLDPIIQENDLVEEEPEEHPVKSCCRFCGETKELNYPTKQLEMFGIDIESLFTFLEINAEYNSYLSEIICDDCFNVISPLGAFKLQCKNGEMKMLMELGFVEEQQVSESTILDTTETFQPNENNEICEEYLDTEDNIIQQDTDLTGKEIFQAESFIEKTVILNDDPDTINEPVTKKPKVQKTVKRSMIYECTACKSYFTDTIDYKKHQCINQTGSSGNRLSSLKCIERVEVVEVQSKQPTRQNTTRKKLSRNLN